MHIPVGATPRGSHAAAMGECISRWVPHRGDRTRRRWANAYPGVCHTAARTVDEQRPPGGRPTQHTEHRRRARHLRLKPRRRALRDCAAGMPLIGAHRRRARRAPARAALAASAVARAAAAAASASAARATAAASRAAAASVAVRAAAAPSHASAAPAAAASSDARSAAHSAAEASASTREARALAITSSSASAAAAAAAACIHARS